MIGRRAQCPLERYGRLVKTARDYPTRPPLRHGQIYDPYKQTIVFLGYVVLYVILTKTYLNQYLCLKISAWCKTF